MSDLRIRSEALEEVWAQPFLPPQAHVPGSFDDGDEGDFGPLLVACSRALTALFGLPVSVVPGRPPRAEGGEPVPRVAPILAALLATLQLGGDPARAAVSGAGPRRQAQAIAEALDAAALRSWPDISRSPGFDLEVSCAGHAGHAHVPAPPRAPVAAAAAGGGAGHPGVRHADAAAGGVGQRAGADRGAAAAARRHGAADRADAGDAADPG